MAVILRYFTEFRSFGAHDDKVKPMIPASLHEEMHFH